MTDFSDWLSILLPKPPHPSRLSLRWLQHNRLKWVDVFVSITWHCRVLYRILAPREVTGTVALPE